jgi:hypothetical protein
VARRTTTSRRTTGGKTRPASRSKSTNKRNAKKSLPLPLVRLCLPSLPAFPRRFFRSFPPPQVSLFPRLIIPLLNFAHVSIRTSPPPQKVSLVATSVLTRDVCCQRRGAAWGCVGRVSRRPLLSLRAPSGRKQVEVSCAHLRWHRTHVKTIKDDVLRMYYHVQTTLGP